MSDEVTAPNAGGADSNPVVKSNITMAELARHRISQKTQGQPPSALKASEPKPEEQPERKAETTKESVPAQAKEAPKAKDVLSNEVDLENMSEAELRELSEKLGSRAVARFGELTAKRKHAEEQLAALRNELNNRNNSDPLASEKTKDNPYASIKTLPDLQAKTQEVDEVIEWADDVLWNNEHLAADDVVATVNGQELTKLQVRKALRDAQKARKDFLPSQLRELQAGEQRKALRGQMDVAARQELEWMGGEDNDVRKQYEILKGSPLLRKAMDSVPDLEPYMEYMVAHAANSIYGRKSINIDKPKASINPPSSPGSSSAQTEQPEGRQQKQERDTHERFLKTNAVSDFIALRTQQILKRK